MEKRSDSRPRPRPLVVENLQNKEDMEDEDEDGDAGKRIRIHVGGLGGCVTEDDLHRLFGGGGGGGTVEEVEIVRTKGRSFAYVDFVPSSHNSLSKLFTTYNGCSWKGGKLRLLKAKEHYLVRLKREWAEDDAAAAQLVAPAENIIKPAKQESQQEQHQQSNTNTITTTKQVRIFFPALRTVKALPFTGTGKHKYSFQRVQVPSSLPIHFCDCGEHSVPYDHPLTATPTPIASQNQFDHGINELELTIMNKVMDKLFQTEKNVSADAHQSTTAQLPNHQHHQHQLHVSVATTPAADDDDDDNLIINVVSTNQEDGKLSEFQELRSSGTQASKKEVPSQNVFKAQKNINEPPNKKRKSLPGDYNNQNKIVAAIPESKKNFPIYSKESAGAQPELGVQQVSWSQKSSWRQLVGHRGSSTFSVSHVLTGIDASTDQAQPKSGSSEEPHSDSKNQDFESNGNLEGQHCEMELVDGCVEPQTTKSSAVSQKSGRGAFWRQQSSWTQLVNDNTNSSFSIKQIVPGISFKQQFVPKPEGADAVSSTESKLKEIVRPDNDKFTRGGSSSLRIGKEGNALRSSPEDTVADNDGACAPDVEKICDLTPKQTSAGNVEIGETCSFVRSDSSLKEWAKIKAALSGSLKRKNIEN